ncbi:hypothetical protein AB0A69_02840 [Streptomyces sp. NPDC045431]|uniref:hypothetical protein n=1 Tax=Streptomyces sp. NPDC045431 TaxID=3155613 RepID=UPI0033C93754
MEDISGTRLRWLRAALFTALVVTLSVASHVLLSGVPLPLTTVAVVAAGVLAVAYALAGEAERGFRRIAGLLIPLELAADTVFTSGQHACYGPSGGPVAGALRSVGVDVLCGGGGVGTPLPGVAAPAGGAAALLHSPDPALPWLLLAAHVSVGLVAAAWLRRGESALAGLVRAVAAFAFRPLLVAVAAVRTRGRGVRRGPRPAERPVPARHRLLVHCVGRRGPPLRPALTA